MKTLIIAAGHKIVNNKIVIHVYKDEIEWDSMEKKSLEIEVHVDWLKDEIIEKAGLIFHSESVKFYDQE